MQALYYIDIREGDANAKRSLFGKLYSPPEKSKVFFTELVDGVIRHRTALDTLIEDFSSHWKISRMSCVDRNILRIAVFEMLARDDIPIKVSINEAIDIGKKYGTEESGAFINGILDSIHQAWKEGRILFEPLIEPDSDKSDTDMEKKEAQKKSTDEAMKNKWGSKTMLTPDEPKRRIIRLAPGLRKRIVVHDRETLK